MIGSAISVRQDDFRESSNYTQVAESIVKPAMPISLENILSRYSELGLEDLERLANVQCNQMELKKNQKLYSLCQGGADIFVVRKGWVSLYHSLGSRGHDICNVYMPGDIVGIRESFFDNHEITIVALENSVLDKVSLEDIHRIYNDCEAIKKAIISYVMVNDNITIERLRSCTHHKAEDRVAHFLLEIFARYNFKEMIGSNVFSFPITQEVVGELLGITSVHVSRCMTVLEQKKMIRKARSTIRLLQPEMMAELTGFDESLIYGCLRRS